MSAWTVYWLFKLDSINFVLILFAIFTGIGTLFLTLFKIGAEVNDDDEVKKACKLAKPIPIIFAVCLLLSTLLPDTKTMAAIIVLPKIASAENLETVGKDAGDIYTLAMQRLKDALGESPKSK